MKLKKPVAPATGAFALAGAVDAGIRRSLRLDVPVVSPRATKALK